MKQQAKKLLKQRRIGDFRTYFYPKIFSVRHFLYDIIFKMRVLLNHQVIWNINGIITISLHNINLTSVLSWKDLMLLEIFWSKNGSKFGQFLT